MSRNKKAAATLAWLLFAAACSEQAFASIVLNGTRIIYHGDKKETTVTVTNSNKTPVLIQNWIDNGTEKSDPSKTSVPFILTPPINRVEQNKGQTLRIRYIGSPALPTDKESVFWLNVLEIPPKAKTDTVNDSKLNVAFRTRVKLFYRPAGLPGTQAQAIADLQWSLHNGGVKVTNPSPYYVSIASLTYQGDGKKTNAGAIMVAPGGSENVNFKNIKVNSLDGLSYMAINDYGGARDYKAKK